MESSDEEDDDCSSTAVIIPGVALHYLDELRDVVLHHQNPDLLSYIAQSTLAVEKTLCGTKQFN